MDPSPPIRQRLAAHGALPRHRHAQAYVAVVLDGGYAEAGETGRRRLAAGDVVVHAAHGAHLNHVAARGAGVLNLHVAGLAAGFGRLVDPDAVARLAERDGRAAAALVRAEVRPLAPQVQDWPDLLAQTLSADPRTCLGAWGRTHGLAAETLSRGFRRVFGATPKRFRYEAQIRLALQGLERSEASLAEVALDAGFADQAHMTRAVAGLTSAPPGLWRRSNGGKTAG